MRPSNCTHEAVSAVLQLVSRGLTLKEACKRARINDRTFWFWYKRGRELARDGENSLHPYVWLYLHWPQAKAARKASLLTVVDLEVNNGDAHLAMQQLQRLEKLEAVGAWAMRKPEAEIVIPEPRPQAQPEQRPQQPAPASVRAIIKQIEQQERSDITNQWGEMPDDWDNE